MKRFTPAIRIGVTAVLFALALPAWSVTAAASAPAAKPHADAASAPARAASSSTSKKNARRDPGLNQPGPAGNRGPTPGVAGNAGPGR